jgi:hypothetical protein
VLRTVGMLSWGRSEERYEGECEIVTIVVWNVK